MDSADTEAKSIVLRARTKAGLTQKELARRVGTDQQTIGKIEKGLIKHSRLFPKIAVELSIPLDTLIPELKAPADAEPPQIISPDDVRGSVKDLPVHAAAMGGPGVMIVSVDPIDWVLRPAPLANVARAYGVIIVGDSMEPEFRQGEVALVHPHLPPERHESFIFYSEQDGEAKATIKHLIKWTDSLWYVEQWNPPKGEKSQFTLNRREWPKCHRVVGKYSR